MKDEVTISDSTNIDDEDDTNSMAFDVSSSIVDPLKTTSDI